MERLRRILHGKRTRRGMFLVAVFLVLFVLPVQPYRPYCGLLLDRPLDLEGPLRPEFADYMEWHFIDNNFAYVRIGDRLFVRLLYPLKWWAKAPAFDSFDDLILNTENKSFLTIFTEDGFLGVRPPPPPVRHIIKEGKAFIQRYDAHREEAPGNVHYAWDNAAVGCYVKYAYVIEVESVPPEKRMQFLNADRYNPPPGSSRPLPRPKEAD
jgi:hypothetical protein